MTDPGTPAVVRTGWRAIKICEPGGRGVIFPAFRNDESEWAKGVRGLLYGVGLLYCFLGVSIVADIFMSAIEVLTSRKKRVKHKDTGRWVTIYIWNSTVANLTLMALGSSAPEILLSVVELFGNDMFSGELGPFTIVGSAAFNLLVIIAVCIMSIPAGEIRVVEAVMVFRLTAIWSVFAYLWLILIVDVTSPGKVTITEGVMTFCFLPILVINAFIVDKYESAVRHKRALERPPQNTARSSKGSAGSGDSRTYHSYISNSGSIPSFQDGEFPLERRGGYRGDGVRMLVAGRSKHMHRGTPHDEEQNKKGVDTVFFAAPCFIVSYQESGIGLTVVREGSQLHREVRVDYACLDVFGLQHVGTTTTLASSTGTITFAPNEAEKNIPLVLNFVSGSPQKKSGYFKVALSEPRYADESKEQAPQNPQIGLGQQSSTYVLIRERHSTIKGGVLTFGTDSVAVEVGSLAKKVIIPIFRVASVSSTPLKCHYRTARLSAVPGYDYEETEGDIEFTEGQGFASLTLTILPKRLGEKSDAFQVTLENLEGGGAFCTLTDGGGDCNILTIQIANENRKWRADTATYFAVDTCINVDYVYEVANAWVEQLVAACFCNGSSEAQKEATVGDWTMHLTVIPWKLFYALTCPPPVSSWFCFCCSLLHIGLITAAVCDLAELFGCVLKIEDSVTALTFVALGTSLPDLFASRTAAQQDETADASIVNVTGSNSVNVFLGVGLSWTLGAIYWKTEGGSTKWMNRFGNTEYSPGDFVVNRDNLTFSVTIFLMAAVTALILLTVRRAAFGGELGGPEGAKISSAMLLVSLWLWYVSLSVWNSGGDRSGADQAVMVFGASALLIGLILIMGVGRNFVHAMTVKPDDEEEDEEVGRKNSSRREEETDRLIKMIPKLVEQHVVDDSKSDRSHGGIGATPHAVLSTIKDMRTDLTTWVSALDRLEAMVRHRVGEAQFAYHTWNPETQDLHGAELPLAPLRVLASVPRGGGGQQNGTTEAGGSRNPVNGEAELKPYLPDIEGA